MLSSREHAIDRESAKPYDIITRRGRAPRAARGGRASFCCTRGSFDRGQENEHVLVRRPNGFVAPADRLVARRLHWTSRGGSARRYSVSPSQRPSRLSDGAPRASLAGTS